MRHRLSWTLAVLLALACSSCEAEKAEAPAYQPPPGTDCSPPKFPQDRCGDSPAPSCLRECTVAELELSCCVSGARCIERDKVTGCETLRECTSLRDGRCGLDGRDAFCWPGDKPGDNFRAGYHLEYVRRMPPDGWPCAVEGAACEQITCRAGKWQRS